MASTVARVGLLIRQRTNTDGLPGLRKLTEGSIDYMHLIEHALAPA